MMMKTIRMALIVVLLIWSYLVCDVVSHGRLREPPSRASMWRDGFDNPPNYSDHQLYCGGIGVQWEDNGGKCGVCGDSWSDPEPRAHEAGGKYANGVIGRTYAPGQTIDVKVELTASHMGYFEFRLCPNNDPTKTVTHECLDQYILKFTDGTSRFTDIGGPRDYNMKLVLPAGLTCSQCLLQWKYHTGNTWCVGDDGVGCNGCCEEQEEFYGCSDITIAAAGETPAPTPAPATTTGGAAETTTTTSGAGTTTTTAGTTTTTTGTTTTPPSGATCHAIGDWLGDPNMDQWCTENCAVGNCPSTHCSCTETYVARSNRQ